MKRRLIYLTLLLGIFAFSSCSEDYLETTPTSAIAESDAFKTTDNALMALNGIHRSMFMQYSNQDESGQGSVMIWMDMLGEDVVMHSAGNGWWNANYQWVMHRSETGRGNYFAWSFYYKIIANANMIIANVDKAVGPTNVKNMIKGEAFALRGWAHFQLVQMFAGRYVPGGVNDHAGVPLMTFNTQEGQPRATVAAVYTQVNADLDSAIYRLDPSRALSRSAKSHINVNVAKGIKARVALTQGSWSSAATLANEARQGFSFMSAAQHLQGYSDIANPEWMWGSMQIDDQTTYFYSFFAYMSYNFSSTNIRNNPKKINSTLYNLIPATDVRKGLWLPTVARPPIVLPTTFTIAPYMNRKFLTKATVFQGSQPTIATSSVGDVPYMRVAEMYLIEAEALARQGGQDAAAASVLYSLANNRNTAYTLSTNTGQALIDEIMLQRRIELWGEGFRFLDLKRLNLPLDRTGANHNPTLAGQVMTVAAGTNEWVFLIPKDELNANKQIGAQNP